MLKELLNLTNKVVNNSDNSNQLHWSVIVDFVLLPSRKQEFHILREEQIIQNRLTLANQAQCFWTFVTKYFQLVDQVFAGIEAIDKRFLARIS